MRVKFLKDVTVDVSKYPCETEDRLFRRNAIIEVNEVIPISQTFSYLTLPSQEVCLDVRNDLFEEVV